MKVNKEEKLIDYLKQFKNYKTLLKNGSVLVNDKIITRYDYMLKVNDEVTINKYNKSKDIKIIYEDKEIIVVDKPYNLLTISNGREISLYNLVSEYVKKNNKNNKIFIVHRLDKDTSGLIVFAKNIKAKNYLQNNWNKVERRYLALVNGITKDCDILKNYLQENKNHFVYVSNTGALAITEYKKIKEINKNSLLDINIKTGKKNQIRVQLSHIGHPILGDKKYGNSDYKRLCLHAYKLVIILNNKEMVFESREDLWM